MSLNLQDVEDIFNVLVYVKISNGGVVNSPFYFNINNIPFSPHFMIIRNVDANLRAGNIGELYVLTNSITKMPIVSFDATNMAFDPQITISLKQAVQQVSFEIFQVGPLIAGSTQATLIPATLVGDNYLTMSIDFVRIKKYDQFAISNKNSKDKYT